MEMPETPSETVAHKAEPKRRRGFRGGGGDDAPVRKAPWALIAFLMGSLFAVTVAAYTWASREDRRR